MKGGRTREEGTVGMGGRGGLVEKNMEMFGLQKKKKKEVWICMDKMEKECLEQLGRDAGDVER